MLFECLWCRPAGEPWPVGDNGDLPPPLRSSNAPSSVLNKTSLVHPSLRHSILRFIVIWLWLCRAAGRLSSSKAKEPELWIWGQYRTLRGPVIY